MFHRLSIFTKFLILEGTLFALLAIVFIIASNIFIKNSFINRSKRIIGNAVQYEARDLQMEDFSLKDANPPRNIFTKLYRGENIGNMGGTGMEAVYSKIDYRKKSAAKSGLNHLLTKTRYFM